MTVPTQNVKNDTSRPMCARHPGTVLPPSVARRGWKTGCWRCIAAKPSYERTKRAYKATEKGRAARRRRNARYRASEKGRASQRRRNARYQATEKGRASHRRGDARYDATEKGRASKRRRTERYRESVRGQLAAHDYNSARRRAREIAWLDESLTHGVPQHMHLG